MSLPPLGSSHPPLLQSWEGRLRRRENCLERDRDSNTRRSAWEDYPDPHNHSHFSNDHNNLDVSTCPMALHVDAEKVGPKVGPDQRPFDSPPASTGGS